MKTDIFNLIILDESGTMVPVTERTISGCNETIDTIRAMQEKYAETQNHYVSIYAFQGNNENYPPRYLVKNEPIGNVGYINGEMYVPWGMTPLNDAVGSTLADLKAIVKEKELAIGSVTIITDGLENYSRYYTHEKVVEMITELKELGWNFNFIGAEIDAEYVARSLNINNYLQYDRTDRGTDEMFEKERRARDRYYGRVDYEMRKCGPMFIEEDRDEVMCKFQMAGANYFVEPELNTASTDDKSAEKENE